MKILKLLIELALVILALVVVIAIPIILQFLAESLGNLLGFGGTMLVFTGVVFGTMYYLAKEEDEYAYTCQQRKARRTKKQG